MCAWRGGIWAFRPGCRPRGTLATAKRGNLGGGAAREGCESPLPLAGRSAAHSGLCLAEPRRAPGPRAGTVCPPRRTARSATGDARVDGRNGRDPAMRRILWGPARPPPFPRAARPDQGRIGRFSGTARHGLRDAAPPPRPSSGGLPSRAWASKGRPAGGSSGHPSGNPRHTWHPMPAERRLRRMSACRTRRAHHSEPLPPPGPRELQAASGIAFPPHLPRRGKISLGRPAADGRRPRRRVF